MVSLHKHGESRRWSKGWEVCRPRQEEKRRRGGGWMEQIPVDCALAGFCPPSGHVYSHWLLGSCYQDAASSVELLLFLFS